MRVTIQETSWNVPLHGGEPFLGYPKWKVVNRQFVNDHQVFYRVTDDKRKWCWGCREFVPTNEFFFMEGETFYADYLSNGKNVSHCMKCSPRGALSGKGYWEQRESIYRHK